MLLHDDIPSDRDTAFLIISPPSLSSQPTSNSAPLTDPTTNAHPIPTSQPSTVPRNPPEILHLFLDSGKKGQHTFLHSVLPQSLDFISYHLAPKRPQQGEEEEEGSQVDRGRNICIACESGKDASVGVAVAALQILFDEEGRYRGDESDGRFGTGESMSSAFVMGWDRISILTVDFSFVFLRETAATKQSIRRRLEWIIASRPQANPSRTTLKRVNDFLLSPQSRMS